ncbi:MAG: tetratricopeptide repeat protein [bacterium]|nr:tetratricopeptide repeat protein [bacterium]
MKNKHLKMLFVLLVVVGIGFVAYFAFTLMEQEKGESPRSRVEIRTDNPALPYNMQELDRIVKLVYKGGEEKALEELARYLEKYPKHDLAWTIKANIHKRKSQDAEAEAAYLKCLEINPRNVQSLCGMGIMCRKRREFDEAVRYYKKALEIKPDFAPAFTSLAVISLKRNQNVEALEYAKKAYDLNQKDPVIAGNLALAYHANGNSGERDKYTAIAKELGHKNIDSLKQLYTGELEVKAK